MSFHHLHREAQIHLVDVAEDRDIHIRYAVAHIPAGMPRIITTNKPEGEILWTHDPAIARRVQVETTFEFQDLEEAWLDIHIRPYSNAFFFNFCQERINNGSYDDIWDLNYPNSDFQNQTMEEGDHGRTLGLVHQPTMEDFDEEIVPDSPTSAMQFEEAGDPGPTTLANLEAEDEGWMDEDSDNERPIQVSGETTWGQWAEQNDKK